MGKATSLPTDNIEEELSSSCSKIRAGVNDTASKASNEVNEHSKGSD